MMAIKVSRKTSLRAQRLLDDFIPPVIRDSRLLMGILLRLVFGRHAKTFMSFKDRAHAMTEDEYASVYEEVAEVELHEETHLNQPCIEAILSRLRGETVLEVGCGQAYLAGKLAATNEVTAVDILISEKARRAHPTVTFREATVEALPYADNSFDSVVCAHTLEHVLDIRIAMNELRRVARRRLVIVVPRQRPYKYGFNLHLSYFPYRWSFPSQLGYHEDHELEDLGDWLYVENYQPD
jgi:ubiquinone/menaquinone biosynthesis C-methylase UbiE